MLLEKQAAVLRKITSKYLSSPFKPAADMPQAFFVTATSQSPGLPETLATAYNPGMCLLALPVIQNGIQAEKSFFQRIEKGILSCVPDKNQI